MNREQHRTHAKAAPKEEVSLPTNAGPIQQLFDQAVRHHQTGRLAEAEALYRRILAADSRHADSLHSLGLIAHQTGRSDAAVELIGQAIAIDGTVAAYHSNRGNALKGLGRLDDALASYDAALRIRPDYVDALANRGSVLKGLGRLDDAIASYDAALRIRPDFAEVHYNRGNALKTLGRLNDAVASYDTALRIRPDHVEALSNRGAALHDLDRLDDAIASYDAALRIRPDFAEALSNRGLALHDFGRLDDALASFEAALRNRPGFAQALYNRGNSLKSLSRFNDAIASYDAALRIRPDYVEALSNRGLALHELGRFDDAIASYDAALRIRPDFAEALSNRGVAFQDLGQLDEAIASYDAALRARPDYAEALSNLAFPHLLRGNFKEGFEKYERRWHGRNKDLKARGFAQPQWQGEDLAGRTILLHSEQGLGDAIQFCRYAPLVAARRGRVILEVPRALSRLLSSLEGVDRFVTAGEPLPAFDLHCPLMSLPRAVGTTMDTIPGQIPYLEAEPDLRAYWRGRLPNEGFRIGIAWQGNPGHKNDRNRSMPLRQFAPLAAIRGVRLVSLQKIHGLEQLSDLPDGMCVHSLGVDYDDGEFNDTAALIMALDLIVTVDSSVAHLAGALGRPTWIALPLVPDWRWMLDRDDSPWYPSVKLFRQSKRGDWDDVFARMAAELSDRDGQA
jgi:tetratricopeptide (TPR) repeat protein